MRRNWIKIYIDQCLRGTMMDEMKDPAERFVWFGFLLLAGDSAYEGRICLTNDMGYSDEQLGAMLRCEARLIRKAKKKMIKFKKIEILKNNIIQIVNWSKYQSEYQRQKEFRQSSPEWKINYNMGTAIYNSLKGKKDGLSWEKLVGFTRKDLVNHLESLFQRGMTWDNYGKRWHIDHIIPRSHFEFKDYNDQRFKKCWSINNLQPLWKEDNLSKGNKLGLQRGVTTRGDVVDREGDIDKKEIRIEGEKPKKIPMSSTFKNDIIFKWNELAKKYNLAAIMEIKAGSLREKNLRARSADENFDFDLLIDIIDNSPFLLGKTKNPFFVFFDWIIKPTNFQKIIEGNYLDRQSYQKFSGIIEGIKDLKKQHEEARKNES